MSNDHIRVSFIASYPFVNDNCNRIPRLKPGPGCSMPGMAVEVLNLITTYLNLTIDVIKVTSNVKEWSTTFSEVYNNETDTYALFFGNNPAEYIEKLDFTKPVFKSNLKLIIKRRTYSFDTLFDFFTIYESNVWISMGVTFAVFTAFGLFVRYIEFKLTLRKRWNFFELLWKMARLQLMQSEEIRYNLMSGRISLLIFNVFQICIVLGLFQSLILTSVVKKINLAPFSVEESLRLIRENKLKFVVSSRMLNLIHGEAQNKLFFDDYQTYLSNDLNRALEKNPPRLVDLPFEAVNSDEKSITLIEEYSWKRWHEYFCDLIPIDGFVKVTSDRFMFKKGSRFTRMFNDAIRIHKYKIGQITLKYMKYTTPSKCDHKRGPAPLSMIPHLGLLIVFCTGIIIAVLVFGCEVLKWIISSKKRRYFN